MRGDGQTGGDANEVLVLGCGFTPLRPVDIILNGAKLQTETADGEGLVVANIGSSGIDGVSIGLNEVEVRDAADPTLSATSYFSYCDSAGAFSADLDGDGTFDVFWNCEQSCPDADQDDDCDVDLFDLRLFSLEWLVGVI